MIAAIFTSSFCNAFETASFSEAWKYLSEKDKSERWVIVSSPKNSAFFQCENLDEVVRCVIPVWIKELPSHGERYRPIGGQETPYPDVKGAALTELMSTESATKAMAVLNEFKLDPFYIYSQVMSESNKIIGTQCDIRIVLDLDYKNFEVLTKMYLKKVFDASDVDGYSFEFDS